MLHWLPSKLGSYVKFSKFEGRLDDGIHLTTTAHLGKTTVRPDNVAMNTPSAFLNATPEQGFQFPGVFELSAMGAAEAGLHLCLPDLLEAAGITVRREEITVRESSGGRYVSVRIVFVAESREQHEHAHAT